MGAEEEMEAVGGWGTWEELILGGAVLRHGTNDWNAVASELRARTFYPCAFTAQACKERYEDLQKRYSGSTAWFDELRKQRVEELKRALAISEDSIGSLESKIRSLKCENKHLSRADNGSNEISNNETSAGSFTKDTTITRSVWSFENQDNEHIVVMRKRRGQRFRKDHNNRATKETSATQSDNLCSNNNVVSTSQKEQSSNDCDRQIRESGANDRCEKVSLIDIFKLVAESEPASVFRHRMDSQKRARYRRVIKQHVDIGTIRSRIIGQSIKSAKELFRDLLLLANNALVFYSRRTREYKSAMALRHIVMEEYKKLCSANINSQQPTSGFIPCNPPVRPRTARPRPQPRPPPCEEKVVPEIKALIAENVVSVNCEGLGKRSGIGDVPRDCLVKDRKGLKRPGKLKRGLVVDTQSRNGGVKQRKRVRL
ncbi:hypothetical protein CASFOL_031569 [Castilleja foliolosa]|uniref:Bromo domain-containing protein n=1 Tax=Castilleja foliolosa TaxID=1961234 RepID=A0ABD3C6D1_9LAMI